MTSNDHDDLTPPERAALRAHNVPPAFPAESLWRAIAAGERRRAALRLRRRRMLALAASIVLFLMGGGVGFAVGRGSARMDSAAVAVTPPVDSAITVTWF